MKAYRTADGSIQLFRPEENYKRMNHSNERLCIPEIDVDFCIKATKKLVEVEKDWVPAAEGTSLYIRPFIIGCEPVLGVHPANNYKFIIILSPSGSYYANGLEPVKIYVEPKYVRTVRGGVRFPSLWISGSEIPPQHPSGKYPCSLTEAICNEVHAFAYLSKNPLPHDNSFSASVDARSD